MAYSMKFNQKVSHISVIRIILSNVTQFTVQLRWAMQYSLNLLNVLVISHSQWARVRNQNDLDSEVGEVN